MRTFWLPTYESKYPTSALQPLEQTSSQSNFWPKNLMPRSQDTCLCKNTKLKFQAPFYLKRMIQLLVDKFVLEFVGTWINSVLNRRSNLAWSTRILEPWMWSQAVTISYVWCSEQGFGYRLAVILRYLIILWELLNSSTIGYYWGQIRDGWYVQVVKMQLPYFYYYNYYFKLKMKLFKKKDTSQNESTS